MKKMKKLTLFILVLVGLLTSFTFLNVNAKTAPSKVKVKSSLYYFSGDTDYISGYNFYRKQLTDGTLAYCVSNINTHVPKGKTLSSKGEITNKGLAYIIKNGYPNKSFTGNAKKDYYITQSAIWLYFDKTNGSHNWRGTTFNSKSTGMKKYVYDLVQEAIAAKDAEVPEPSISLINVNTKLNLNSDGTYFVSDPVQVVLENTKGVYTITLTNAPEGTIIKDENGNTKTEFNDGEKFVIYVPASSIKNGESGTVSLKVEAEGVTYVFYKYGLSSSSYQKLAPVEEYEKITKISTNEITFNYSKNKTSVKISKQDVTSKEELPGAKLQVKDKNGEVVAEWVSGNEPHYIEGLEPGEYTLTEVIAPEGYVLSTSSIKFTVNANGTTTNVVMYNEKEKETTVKISKQDITSKEELPGAKLQVKDKNGKVIDEWVSGNEPHYIKDLEPGEYTLTEVIAPEGYILSEETVKFTVKKGSTTNVVMYNAKDTTTTKVKVSKQDITSKEELPGATLVIKDKEGNTVDEWVSGKEPHYIEGLEPGEYTLTEKIAPEGYALSEETIKFTVKDDGSITSVVMYNTRYTEVPITDMNVSSLTIIFASILITLGTGMVVSYVKHSK